MSITSISTDDKSSIQVVKSSVIASEPLALLDCGDVNFLVPAKDILTLSSAQKMALSNIPHACGELNFEEAIVPVFAISKSLQLNSERPANHLTLIVLQHQGILFGLSCVTLTKIEINDLQFFTVPVSMSSRKQPFSQFAIVNKRAAGLTSAFKISRLLSSRGVAFSTSADVKAIQEAS